MADTKEYVAEGVRAVSKIMHSNYDSSKGQVPLCNIKSNV